MEKAMYVLPCMPKKCSHCSLQVSPTGLGIICVPTLKDLSDDEYYNKKPNWCPLQPMTK